MVLLSTGPGDVPNASGGDFDANGFGDFDRSTLSLSFNTVIPGQILSFDWAFITSEANQATEFDDFFIVQLDGVPVLTGSVNKPGGVSPFLDTAAYDGVSYTVSSPGPTNGSDFASGVTPFQPFCIALADPGPHTLTFQIADQEDSIFDSGLLIDNLRSPSTCGNLLQVTDSSGSQVELKDGALELRIHDNRQLAASNDGDVLAFISNGNFTADNPNAENQVFVAEGGIFERITAQVGGQVGGPALTSNGRWLTFESSADLLPGGPGNSDGNLEIFRFDRVTSTLRQVTATAGCANRHPTISHNAQGRRIAFATDCTDLLPGFNADGNAEIVLWDANTNTFQTNETTGCTSRDPVISTHNAGRFVTFVSTCDPTGGNGDGNAEIFQWDRRNDSFRQVTASSTAAAEVNDSPSASVNGRFVAFVSNADYTGNNPDGSLEAFRFDRNGGGSFIQLTDGDALSLFLTASIEDSGRFVAIERFDVLTTFSEVLHVDSNNGLETPVASGRPALPVMALDGGVPIVAFQAQDDFSGGNVDGNSEIWQVAAAFRPPAVRVHCSNPLVPIPDNDPAGVTDVLTVSPTGLLQDLDVTIDLTHTAVGDLILDLEHTPTGTIVRLLDRPGAPPGSGCDGDDILATLDDEASDAAETTCLVPVAINGTLTPTGILADFDGEDISGDWTLTVSDNNATDTGVLRQWCLRTLSDP